MRFFIVIFIIIVIGLTLDFLGPTKIVSSLFVRGSSPILIRVSSTTGKTANFFQIFGVIGDLKNQNQQLSQENLNLKSQLATLAEIKHENEILKSELGFKQSALEATLIPAQIIARPPAGFLKYLSLNRGTDDGVKVGQAVVSQGYLVGRVESVQKYSSQVLLISNVNSLIPVTLQTSRGSGLLQGGLTGLVVRSISADTQIQNDENVITSDLGGFVPVGILVGKFQKTISSESEIFKKISISSPIEFNKLEIVFIIR